MYHSRRNIDNNDYNTMSAWLKMKLRPFSRDKWAIYCGNYFPWVCITICMCGIYVCLSIVLLCTLTCFEQNMFLEDVVRKYISNKYIARKDDLTYNNRKLDNLFMEVKWINKWDLKGEQEEGYCFFLKWTKTSNHNWGETHWALGIYILWNRSYSSRIIGS